MKEIFTKDYHIFWGNDALEKLSETLINKEYSKIFVLMDTHTEKWCWPLLKPYLMNFETMSVPAGENSKSLSVATHIYTWLQENFADRRSVLLNLGGGVVSDLGGFCAGTYKRGIDFINIPTTLLGMVDASVGGKQGLDLLAHKNMIGIFKHPSYIFVHPPFLQTLEPTEYRNGLAEVCKHALVDSKKQFEKLEEQENTDGKLPDPILFQSQKIKAEIVNKDPLEKGLRKILNFGHTIGHAVESYSLQNDKTPLKHGEAVAVGMICEAYISRKISGLSEKEFERIVKYINRYFPKYHANWDEARLLQFMRNDKKNREGLINFSLLKKIGKAVTDINCHDDLILQSLDFYKKSR